MCIKAVSILFPHPEKCCERPTCNIERTCENCDKSVANVPKLSIDSLSL